MLSRSFDPEDELTASAEWIRITDGKRLGLHTEAMVAAAPLLLVGVSIEMERECHQNDSLADGQVAVAPNSVTELSLSSRSWPASAKTAEVQLPPQVSFHFTSFTLSSCFVRICRSAMIL